ncbi:MAG: PKD-like family lipoprotein [Arachidicoccus sp.]|nr:PKD-like family lipoprotein [Arachidicoccus sp.]
MVYSSCKKNDYSINELPDITITADAATEHSIGDTVRISPEISYGGQSAEFTYKWYKVVTLPSYAQVLVQLSTDNDFVAVMDSLGTYEVREEVTNVSTGITAAITLSWNVVSRAERGWYILKSTSDGNTDMDAFLTTTSGNLNLTDIVTAKKGSPMTGNPVGIAFTSVYYALDTVTNKFSYNNSCLMPVSTKEIMAYRIKDEKILAKTNRLFYEVPDSTTRSFEGLASDPNLMVLVNHGRLHGMNPISNCFLPERLGDYSLSPYFTLTPHLTSTDAGYILGFDQQSESFVIVRYKQTDLSYFPDVYLNSSSGTQYNISSNNMGGKLIFLENTDGSLDTLLTTNGRAYGLLRKDNSKDLVLLGLNLAELIPTRYNGAHSPVRYADTITEAKHSDITSASLYALNKNNPILYYTNDNQIGAYNIESKSSQNIYSFPSGETITYIKFIDCEYDTPTTNNFTQLVVATYNNGHYKVYRFTVLGNTLVQSGSVMEGNGKVKSLIYTTPNTTSFFNAMYRYY